MSEVMLAFAKAVNLNSESLVQRSLARALRRILESYFSEKSFIKGDDSSSASRPSSTGTNSTTTTGLTFSDDERHAVQALVRSYISDISFSSPNKLIRSTTSDPNFLVDNPSPEGSSGINQQVHVGSEKNKTEGEGVDATNDNTAAVAKNQIFEKIPSFVNFLLSIESPGGSLTPASKTFSPSLFGSQENMESYIRLLVITVLCCFIWQKAFQIFRLNFLIYLLK